MEVFIVLHLLFQFALFLLVLFMCPFLNCCLWVFFCMLSLWGMVKCACSLQFFYFQICASCFCHSLVFSRVFEQP